MDTTRRKAAYPLRFLGRHLEDAVRVRVESGDQGSEADVARSLDTDPSTFNRWINGYSHPRTAKDWERLQELGLNAGFLRRLQLLDKLDAWRRDHGMSIADLVNYAIQIQSDQAGQQIFRPPGRRPG